ncbi:MAG: L-serine ammonia-lyase, iron-sulfur-dependent, subunit alpha [Clostridia bacterium]
MTKQEKEECFISILKEELVPALGCTEPIAIALASAKARETLGKFPDSVVIEVSGNIIKNVKSVVVPMTNGLKGVETACIVGIVGGKSELGLEVLQQVSPQDVAKVNQLLKEKFCKVEHLESTSPLHIIVRAYCGNESSLVELRDGHSAITRIERNGITLFSKQKQEKKEERLDVDLADIYEFASKVAIEKVEGLISRQIECNCAICEEGLRNNYGQSIGRTLIQIYGSDARVLARAKASAGSDARMSGCNLPVIINSGSGNQGITVCVPVVEFAKEFKSSREQLLRAVTLSNLVAIYLKRGIGKLSAYCGVVSASCGAGAGITFLGGGSYAQITSSISNTLANVSGIVCDGAKGSCAAKIASSVDACIIGHYMAMNNNQFNAGDGIVKDDIEKTIDGVSRIGKYGMKETDLEILSIMLEE